MAVKFQQRLMTVLAMVVLALGLMACGAATPGQPGQPDDVATPEAPAATATPEVVATDVPTDTGSETGGMDITWSTSPDDVIAQYAIVGGFRMRPSATELPQWTLYGDGTVIYTTEGGTPSLGFTTPVLIGKLSESEIRELLTAIEQDGFWDLEDRYSNDGIADAAAAVIYVDLTDQAKQVLVYPAGREDAPPAFVAVMDRLLATQPADAVEHVATEFTLIAESLGSLNDMPADSQASFADWTIEGVTLADSLGEGQKVDAAQAQAIQDFVLANNTTVSENGEAYLIRLEAVAPRMLRPISMG